MKLIGVSNLLCAAWALSFGLAATQAIAADPAPRTVAPESQICKACHASYVESFEVSKHGQKGNLKGPDCQTCHANALEHAKAGGGRGAGGIFGFNKAIPAEKKAEVCLACHQDNRHLAFWDSGKHKKNDVSCNNCHTLHGTPGPGSTIALKKSNPTVSPYETTVRQLQYETCTSCHKQIRSQLLKPSHHPIIEGKLACTNCHNPHGALSNAMINSESVRELCISCHTEKRGPFMWEHPPVEENCLICHNAHGSNHNRLLAEKAPNVCQDCHDAAQHPGTIYSGNNAFNPIPPATVASTRLIARGCVNCHNNLHGSNAPGFRGKVWQR